MINWISASESPFQTLLETRKHDYKKEREKQKHKTQMKRSFTKERKYVFTNLIYIPTPLHRRSVNSLGMVNSRSFVELQDRIFGLHLTTSQKLNFLTAYEIDIWFGLLDLIIILNDNLYKY